jgi:hypothetical protein
MPFTPERVWRAIHDATARPQVSNESKKGGKR